MADDVMKSMRRYTCVYTFNGYLREEYAEAISLITETIADMQHEGINIKFLGATQEVNSTGQLTELTARYAAPTKGAIGYLNYRACLPASGQPQREKRDATESESQEVAIAGHS